MDDKIEAVNTEIKRRIEALDKKFLELEKRVKDVEEYCKTKTEEGAATTQKESVQHLSEVTDRQAQIKRLEYRTLDQEARGRRNNVLIFNLEEEDDEDPATKLQEFIQTKLGVTDDVAVQRVHRMGRAKRRDGKPRALIACLRDYPDVDRLLRNATKLKGSRYGLSRDYPETIRRARARLEPERRAARRDNKKATIAYPAKLVVDGTVTHDEFPDWTTVLYSRD